MTVKPTNQGWPQAGDLAVETALPVTANVSRTDGQTVLSSMDTLFGGILEDRSARFVGGGTITLSTNGQTLTFGERLDFVYNNAGTQQTITSIVAAAGTLTFSSNNTLAYIVLTKGSPGSAALTSNSSTLPAATTSQEVFLLAMRRDDISGTQRIYLSDGTSILSGGTGQLGGGGAGGLTPSYQATTFNAVTNYNYLTNTTSSAFTATLPTGAAGNTIQFVDDAGTWGTHNLTIAPATGQSIQGISGTGVSGALVANLSGAFVQLSWDATNSYWVVTTNGYTNGASGSLATAYQAANFNAVAGNNYQVNTTSAPVTATLPAGATGVTIQFIDDASTFATNNLTITPQAGQTIQGITTSSSLVMNLNGSFAQLSWDSTNSYWTVTSTGFQYGPTYSPGVTGGIISSAGVLGATSGSAVTTGFVGEKLTWATPPVDQTITTLTDWTNANIVLSAGVWMVTASVQVLYGGNTSANTFGFATVQITDSSNVIIQNQQQIAGVQFTGASSSINGQGSVVFAFVASVSGSTTYKIRASGNTNGTVKVLNSSNGQSTLFATRIA
jgi:hypothetical protein